MGGRSRKTLGRSGEIRITGREDSEVKDPHSITVPEVRVESCGSCHFNDDGYCVEAPPIPAVVGFGGAGSRALEPLVPLISPRGWCGRYRAKGGR